MPLDRYGLDWHGPREFVCRLMPDGYWTPWHIAEEAVALERERAGRLVREALERAAEELTDWASNPSAPNGKPIDPPDLEAIAKAVIQDEEFEAARRAVDASRLAAIADAEARAEAADDECRYAQSLVLAERERADTLKAANWQAVILHGDTLARAEKAEAERDWAYAAFKRIAINVCQMDSDNKQGDFELPKLARLDLDACVACCADLPEAFVNWTEVRVVPRAELQAERDALRERVARIKAAAAEVLRISDRKHDAWDALKAAIAEAGQ